MTYKIGDSPFIDKAIDLIGQVYKYHEMGGDLHIVLEDDNLDNDSLKFCWAEAARDRCDYNDDGCGNQCKKTMRDCIEALSFLTIKGRRTALRYYRKHMKSL